MVSDGILQRMQKVRTNKGVAAQATVARMPASEREPAVILTRDQGRLRMVSLNRAFGADRVALQDGSR